MSRKENLVKETKYLFIATQNNVISSNYIKAKLDNMQKDSKFTL